MTSAVFQKRAWLVAFLVVAVAWLFVKEALHFEWPIWVMGLTTAFAALIGAIVIIQPDNIPAMRPLLARASGILLIAVAIGNAYILFTSN